MSRTYNVEKKLMDSPLNTSVPMIIDLIHPFVNEEDVVKHRLNEEYGLGVVIRVGWSDESNNDDDDDDDELLQDQIEIHWINDNTYTIEQYRNITVLDRSFLHGDICVQHDNTNKLGSVVDIDVMCSVRVDDSTVLHEINTRQLRSTIDYLSELCVVNKTNRHQYGIISDALCDLTIQMNTKQSDVLVAPDATPYNVIPVDGDLDDLDDVSNNSYYIGQRVELNKNYMKQRCMYSDGGKCKSIGKQKYTGMVIDIKPVMCDVVWLDNNSRTPCQNDNNDDDEHIDHVKPDNLLVFVPNQHVRWQLGDRCRMEHNGM